MIFVSSFNYSNFNELANKTKKNHLAYCRKHGYSYLSQEIKEPIDKLSGYDALCEAGLKNAQIIDRLLSMIPEGDILFTLGCDAIICNMDISIETIIFGCDEIDIFAGTDKAGINTSQLIIRNTEQSRKYFKEMLMAIEYGSEHDQRYMWDNPRPFIFKMNQRSMNSYDHELRLEKYDSGQHFVDGDFLVHLAGSTLEQRMSVVDKWLGKAK